jgi:PKD repeat protein
MKMMYNKIIISIFTGLLFLFCIGGVHGAVINIDDSALAGNAGKISVSLDEAQKGLAGYQIEVTFDNPAVEITKVEFPPWTEGSLKKPNPFDITPTDPVKSAVFVAVDLYSRVQPGTIDVELFAVEIRSDGAEHQMKLFIKELTDHAGDEIKATIGGGQKPTPTPTTTSTITPTPTTTPTTNVTPTITPTPNVTPTTTPDKPKPPTTHTPQPTVEPTAQPTGGPTPNITPNVTPTIEPTPEPTIAPLAAAFTLDKRAFGVAPTTFHFTDKSTGNPETYFWNFGDGETSVVQNPRHTYRRPGTYTVSLTISKGNETSRTELDTAIHIIEPRPIPIARQNGILAIGSIPQGADIYLNGAHYGQTPILIPNLTPNTYQVRLVKSGYYDSVTTIPIFTPVKAGENGPVPSYRAAILLKAVPPNVGKVAAEKPQTGSAYIVTYPKEVDVYFEGSSESIGSSDIMITHIPTGLYNITLKRDGFADWPGQIEVLTAKTVMQVYHYEYPTYGPVPSEYFDQPTYAEGDE